MARWRLSEPHYIYAEMFGEATEWEYKETDRVTGRERRKRFEVPLYCEAGWIVSHVGSERADDNGQMGPVTFKGNPTPGMEPIDDEAKAISTKLAPSWQHPIDSLPGQGFGDALLGSLQKQFAAMAATTPAQPVIAEGVSKEEFESLKSQLAALMAEKAEREAKPETTRRKIA